MKTRHRHDAFGWTFLVCLVLVSLPIKNFAYVVPPVYLFLQILAGNHRLTIRTMVLTSIVLAISSVSLLWDSCRGQEVNVQGMFLAVLTFLPLLIILCERRDKKMDDATFAKLIKLCSWFVIVQSVVGMIQFLASNNPDAVCGTFGLFDFVNQRITIAHVYFTFTIYGMILFLSCDMKKPLPLIAIALGLVTTTLAHSAHQIIFFVVSLGFVAAFRFWRPRMIVYSAILITMVCLLVNSFYPETLSLAEDWYGKVAQDSHSPKRLATASGASILSDAKNLLIGTGMGQFSSRAALITSNEYLSTELPKWLTSQSDYYHKTIRSANFIYQETGEGSAMAKPYYSLLSVVVEFGALQSLVLAWLFFTSFVRNVRLMGSRQLQISSLAMRASIGMVFFLLCCTIENYAEFPQAIFLPLLLYVAALSRVHTLLECEPALEAQSVSHPCPIPMLGAIVPQS